MVLTLKIKYSKGLKTLIAEVVVRGGVVSIFNKTKKLLVNNINAIINEVVIRLNIIY